PYTTLFRSLNDFDSLFEVISPVSRPQNRPRLGRILCRGRAEEQQLLNRDKHSRRLPRLPVNALLNTLNAALIIKHPSVNRILATNRQLLPPNRTVRGTLVHDFMHREAELEHRQGFLHEIEPR